MTLGMILEPSDRALSGLKVPEPKRNYASTPSQRETQ